MVVNLVTVLELSKFNLFEYITFVPEEYQYEIGLTVYLTFIETLYGGGKSFIDSKKAKVVCVFLNRKWTRIGKIFRL